MRFSSDDFAHSLITESIHSLLSNFSYALIIFTNQGSISLKSDPKTAKSDQKSLATFKAKTAAVFGHFDFPITLLAATARDQYRKPRTGMWSEVLEDLDLDEGDGPDLLSSFFVGDAGGRAARTNAKADHSCSDRLVFVSSLYASTLIIQQRLCDECGDWIQDA